MAIAEEIRLQKYLAAQGIASRRKAEDYIRAGRIKVDGKVVTEMGTRICPDTQIVHFDNRLVSRHASQKLLYVLLHKPRGYITTLSDPQGRPIITSLLTGINTRLFPVGRLDMDSEGALLMTNDGSLANKILHPKFETNKTYEALVKGRPLRGELSRLRAGIVIDGKRTWPAKIHFLKQYGSNSLFRIIIHEGRKHQIRKMFGAIEHPVIRLKRTAYGRLTLGTLKSGSYRFLSSEEVKKIFL